MAQKAVSEADLDLEFASALEADPGFLIWILSGGRFAQYANEARILIEEQRSARKTAAHWWKHWWCRLPNGIEGETDVFLVLQAGDLRFALHIENKPPSGSITLIKLSGIDSAQHSWRIIRGGSTTLILKRF